MEEGLLLAICFQVFVWGALPTYIVGGQDNKAILWITDLAGSSLNSITLADDGASSIASSITSAFQQIYCAGMQSNNGHDSATIWIRDLSGSLVKTATFQEPGFDSTAYCIAACSNQLFLGGQREINGTTEKIASLWITDASASTEAVFNLEEKIMRHLKLIPLILLNTKYFL